MRKIANYFNIKLFLLIPLLLGTMALPLWASFVPVGGDTLATQIIAPNTYFQTGIYGDVYSSVVTVNTWMWLAVYKPVDSNISINANSLRCEYQELWNPPSSFTHFVTMDKVPLSWVNDFYTSQTPPNVSGYEWIMFKSHVKVVLEKGYHWNLRFLLDSQTHANQSKNDQIRYVVGVGSNPNAYNWTASPYHISQTIIVSYSPVSTLKNFTSNPNVNYRYGPTTWPGYINGTSDDLGVSGMEKVRITVKNTSQQKYLRKYFGWGSTLSYIDVIPTPYSYYGDIVDMWSQSLPMSIFPSDSSGNQFLMEIKAINTLGIEEKIPHKVWFIWDGDPPTGESELKIININGTGYINGEGQFTKYRWIRIYSDKISDNVTTNKYDLLMKMTGDIDDVNANKWISYSTYRGFNVTAGDGTKTIRVSYKDQTGNEKTDTHTVKLDQTAPTGTLSIDSGATYTNDSSRRVTLKLNVSDGAGSGIGAMMASEDSSFTDSSKGDTTFQNIYEPFYLKGDGFRTVHVKLKDNAGNVSGLISDGIYVDTEKPDVNITYPPQIYGSENGIYPFSSVSGTFSDMPKGGSTYASGVERVIVAVGRSTNGTDYYFYNYNSRSFAAFYASWPPTNDTNYWKKATFFPGHVWKVTSDLPADSLWTNEKYKVVAFSYDKAGNESEEDDVTGWINKTPPTSTVEAFTPNATKEASFTVKWKKDPTSSQPDSYTVQYKLNSGGTWGDWAGYVNTPATQGIFTAVQEGTYYFRSIAKKGTLSELDVPGAVPGAGDASIMYDHTKPTGSIVITNGPATTEGRAYLNLSVTDNVSPPEDMKMKIWGNVTPDERDFQTPFDRALSAGDGQKTIYIQYGDKAGNTSEVYSDTIIKDTDDPDVLIINTPSTGTVSNIPMITGEAHDAGSGIAKVEVKIRKPDSGQYRFWLSSGGWSDLKASDYDGPEVWNLTALTPGSPNDTWSFSLTPLPTWLAGDTYFVRIVAKATDGVGKQLTQDRYVTVNPVSLNNISLTEGINWISLPYTNSYTNARSIADSINGAKTPGTSGTCTEVGKWLTGGSGGYEKLSYVFGSWLGTNFTVEAGVAYYVSIKGAPIWSVSGTHDPSFAFNLPYNQNGTNIYWISLPYGSTYLNAQAIVNDINGGDPGTLTVVEIGRQPPGGATEKRSYTFTFGWQGTNFAFRPGEGYYISIRKPLTNWTPK